MKVSLNWVKEYTRVDLSVDELVEKIGAQLGAVEEVVDLGKKYQGIVIAKISKCEKHPNADKLSLCTIDDGGVTTGVNRDENSHIQVVCGAPNVREGLIVAWLPPGTVVPSTFDKDPFKLEAREIRGIISNGMIASAKELGISDDHSGVLELNPHDAKPGDDFAETYKLNDCIIDIENKMFTHRPDCFGMLGVAREIAGVSNKKFISPDWYIKENSFEGGIDEQVAALGVTNHIPELCPRYMAVVVSGIKVGPSPIWLQTYLSRVGVRPVNNIVDMTNYMMILTGQPLHAFDFDKVAVDGNAQIVVRKPTPGEKMTLLDGKTIEPRPDAILICDPHKPIALGGVMGGNNSEIDENTKRIIIECANFDMYNIRKTAMEHGVFSDAVTRFTKGQSPLQCVPVLYKAVQVTQEVSPDAQPVGETVDSNHASTMNRTVEVTADFINVRLGLSLSAEEMVDLLQNVEFEVNPRDETMEVVAPFWRTDIHIPEDVVEEVGRLYGYDKLPLELPKRDLTPPGNNAMLELKKRIREVLASAGANEVLTYSFVHGNLLEKAGQKPEDSYRITNALSPELQYYRQTLTPSLLDKVHANVKAGYDEFTLFEINKTHNKIHGLNDENVPGELEMLALTYAGSRPDGTAYFQARKYLDYLAGKFGLTLAYQPIAQDPGYPVTRPYDFRRSALVAIKETGTFLGLVGEYRAEVVNRFKLPVCSAGFEIGTEHLLDALGKSGQAAYTPLPRFPKVVQDISIKVPDSLPYGELYEFMRQSVNETKPAETLADLEPVDIYQRENDKEHKQVTLRLTIASYERTMMAEEVNNLLDQVAAAAKDKFDAVRI